MKRVAEESGCQYFCNQDNFLCRNGDVNLELVAVDGLHLSKLGTERLIENLKLHDTAYCRIGRSQRPGLDPQQKHSRPWRGTEPAAPGGHHRTGQRASHQASSNRPAATQYQASKSRTKPPGGKGPVHYGRNSNHTRTNDISHQNIQSNGFCHFCGESNHLRHVCRYGMPVTCFRCHRTGHKEKFCELYAWSDGEEGSPDFKPPYMYKDFIVILLYQKPLTLIMTKVITIGLRINSNKHLFYLTMIISGTVLKLSNVPEMVIVLYMLLSFPIIQPLVVTSTLMKWICWIWLNPIPWWSLSYILRI